MAFWSPDGRLWLWTEDWLELWLALLSLVGPGPGEGNNQGNLIVLHHYNIFFSEEYVDIFIDVMKVS